MQSISKYKKRFADKCGAGKKSALCAAVKRSPRTKTISFFVALLILVLSSFIVSNFTYSYAAQDNVQVKAGVFHLEGYHAKDENGNLTGYGIEFLNLVSEYSNISFIYTAYNKSWENMLDMLESGDIDVVTSASRTEGRESKFIYSLSMGRKKTVLSISVDDIKHIRGDYSTYNGIKVGLLEGNEDTANKLLAEFAKEKKFTYETPKDDNGNTIYYQSDAELAAALQRGEIDAILTSDLRKTENETTLDIIADNDFYAIARRYLPKKNKDDENEELIPDKESEKLIEEINYAIRQMDINEGDWQNALFYKYYGPVYSSALSFTPREKEYLQQVIAGNKTISVTAFGNRAPYSYTEKGVLKGILPDYFAEIMKLAANAMGVDGIEYELKAPTDEDHYDSLAKDVDVVLDSVTADTIEEDAVVQGFNTITYMTARMARVTRLNHSGEIKKIAVAESQGEPIIRQALNAAGYTDDKIKTCDTGTQALQAVLDNKADAAYVYSYSAQYFINNGHSDELYYSSVNGMVTPISMHISENTNHELLTIINKCIKQIPDDTFNQLANEYISVGPRSFGEYLKDNPGIIIAVVIVIVLTVFIILALYLRGQWNKKMLHTTEQTNKKIKEQLSIVEALSRDYTNVYSVNEELETARILKLEGYVTEGIQRDSIEEYNYNSILQSYIRTRVHPDDREELTAALSLDNIKAKLAASDEFQGSYRILSDGEIHHFQFTYLKIADKENGHDSFILAGFRNIDEMIRKEQEQKNALSEALAQAQYANKAKTTFLNNMSHDIRTPMNAIIGFTSLAATHLDNKEQIKDYLSKIMTSGNHLLSLINDVLDMSRIESGKVKIEEKETSLPEIMHDLKTIVQADVKSKQLEFYIDTLDVTNETIICDKLRLNQVLLNLLSNAMKYTKPGGMVSVRVIQTADAPEGYASYKFSVKDTGIGMSPEFLKHVFEPFEREQTSTVSGIQGTGLGLAITKNIVDMMNGTITVESEVGKGSEFVVTFCFRVTENVADTQKLEHLENLRALVVDDDVNTCVSVSKMLSTIGMRPDWTTLGNEAVIRTEFAMEQNEPYSAYIIDWLMPDMNGIELVRRIRKIIGDLTPVIILTAYDWTDIEQEAREAGVTAFCSKPLFLSELRNALAAPSCGDKEETTEEKEELRFDGKKILLVEDNELNLEIAQTILEAAGFVIDTADDGSVAVEKMKTNPAGTYDLILMDVQMPIMNGYEATRAIRALGNKKKASIPIVAMTANAFDEDRKEAMDAGMNGYAAKPIEIDKLMQTLKEILK